MSPELTTEDGFALVAVACAVALVWLIVKDAIAEQHRKRKR